MKFELIDAETHTSEYLLHKYWARKPHNVLASLIKTILPNGGKLLDPCCGSGVSLREAAKLGVEAMGIDLNPIACLISEVLIAPPNVDEFNNAVLPIINKMEQLVKTYYCDDSGKEIKYLIHKIKVKCKCGELVDVDSAQKDGKKLNCPFCGQSLSFNLENLVDTNVTGYCVQNELKNTQQVLEIQKKYSDCCILGNNTAEYITSFYENRRILAFNGMTTDLLFTKRNFSILAQFAEYFEKIKNEKIKNAALLLLTASSAQCSRLIPSRNNLTTGGPSWSIPGFWVPKEHLETNPIVHIKARYKKFVKGLSELASSPIKASARVVCANSIQELEKNHYENSYDLIFFDPPYGDSVPYVEFSTFWNSFLKKKVDVSQDISVSDRLNKKEAWEKYENEIITLVTQCKNALCEQGKMLITFNNNDLRAWKALLKALQFNGFKCTYATYQMPAVISSKAQKAIDSSYISDIYSVYDKGSWESSKDLTLIIGQLKYAAIMRGGEISESICRRIALVHWLLYNIDYRLLDELDAILNSLFEKKQSILKLKPIYLSKVDIQLKDMCRKKASDLLKNGPMQANKLLLTLCNELYEFGMPDPTEAKRYLRDFPIEKSRYIGAVNLLEPQNYVQLSLLID